LAGDDALLNQVARVFIRTVPQLLKDIGSALAIKDGDRAYAEAHSLKGAVAVLEAPEVLASIVVLETHAINYNADAAATSLAAAEAMVTRLCAELQSLLDSAAKPTHS
jgi:HPt (histidine-containing phosphotransfer) domain-containing protein